MSRNPYHGSSSSSPDPLEHERQQRSHWALEETPARHGQASFVEKFSPTMTSNRAYEPSIRSNKTEMPGNAPYQPWMQRSASVAGSETNSLPSYHDSPSQSRQGFTANNKSSLRYKLDHGKRARVYLFIGLTSCMLFIFLLTALVWLQLDLVKKTAVVTDADTHTVRPS